MSSPKQSTNKDKENSPARMPPIDKSTERAKSLANTNFGELALKYARWKSSENRKDESKRNNGAMYGKQSQSLLQSPKNNVNFLVTPGYSTKKINVCPQPSLNGTGIQNHTQSVLSLKRPSPMSHNASLLTSNSHSVTFQRNGSCKSRVAKRLSQSVGMLSSQTQSCARENSPPVAVRKFYNVAPTSESRGKSSLESTDFESHDTPLGSNNCQVTPKRTSSVLESKNLNEVKRSRIIEEDVFPQTREIPKASPIKHKKCLSSELCEDANKENNNSKIFGIRNLGNTCYMNSALQCILGLDSLVNDILALYSESSKVNWPMLFESVCRLMTVKKAQNVTLLHRIDSIIQNLWSEFSSLNPRFTLGEMQDCGDFLSTLIENLKSQVLESQNEENPMEPFSKNLNFDICVTSECKSCNYRIEKTEQRFVLHTAIPDRNDDMRSIQDCVGSHFEAKESWLKCPKCSDGHKAQMHTELTRLPRVLIIELSRCVESVGDTSRIEKTCRPVLIPKCITLRKYSAKDCDAPPKYSNSQFQVKQDLIIDWSRFEGRTDFSNDASNAYLLDEFEEALRRSEVDININDGEAIGNESPELLLERCDWNSSLEDNEQNEYRITSIISHRGSKTTTGHYVCDVFDVQKRCWTNCSDNSVKQVSEEDVLKRCRSEGCIFSYTHRDFAL